MFRKSGKQKVHSSFKDDIWRVDLADMQLIRKFNKGICFLLCIIYNYCTYARLIPLKYTKGTTIANAFQKKLDESKRKTHKMWVEKGREVYNRSMKSCLKNNGIEMYSTRNEGKSVAAETFN